jgi:tRNA (guanine26-N2/guanine27-N2)-dimethyltransferase
MHEQASEDLLYVTEGKAKISVFSGDNASRVFYNPRMNLNRDIAILFAQSYFAASRTLRICEPMSASGVRAVRYVLELPHTTEIVAGDKTLSAVEATLATAQLNHVENRISVFASDASLLLLNHENDRFDLIDLDPFGSPAPFFESALKATTAGGVIAATATDMGPLTGARASACLRKYGVTAIRTGFEKEMAARALAGSLVESAGRLGLGVDVVFTHATDHYCRIYAAVSKGKAKANVSTQTLGFLEYCPKCLRRDAYRSLQSIQTTCVDCGGKSQVGGPYWIGKLWDPNIVRRMIRNCPELQSPRLSEVQRMLSCVEEECEASPFYYRTDLLSNHIRIKPPKLRVVLDALRCNKYKATRTHFDPLGFRVDAPNLQVLSIARSLPKES